MSQVVVIVGGAALHPSALREVDTDAHILAVDGGLDHARAAGLTPTALVGDLDSISDSGLRWARAQQLPRRTFERDKDLTDTALALGWACELDADRLLVVGGRGDRLDHLLGVIAALGGPAHRRFVSVGAVIGQTRLHTVFPGHQVTIRAHETPGDGDGLGSPDGGPMIFSVLAAHGTCRHVAVRGARWPLDNATIEAWSTLGVSNEAHQPVTIQVGGAETGAPITVVVPGGAVTATGVPPREG